jgi:type I restriction enzyme, S subunit
MKNRWQKIPFGDCVSMLSGGTPSKAKPSYWSGDIPWVSCKDMKVERLFDAEDHLTEEGAASGTRTVPAGTVLIVVRGMILAKEFPVAIAKRPVAFNQDLKALQCNIVTDEFIFYWLKANTYDILGIVDEAAHGTKRLQSDRLQKLLVAVPPRQTQDAIVRVLCTYDDLIENNTRRIKILEEMAQMIYREWFVNFHFLGHEKVRMVKSELGPIPEGWSIRSLREMTSCISRGISPTYDESAAGWVINQKCIRDHRLNLGPARKQSKPVPPEKALRKGDILINSTGVGTLGRVAQVHRELVNFTVDSHVSIVRPTRNADYLGEVALQLESSFEAMGVGSTGQTELGRERIAGTTFVCPPDSLQALYADHAQGIHQLSLCLLQKIENLRTTRDLLLPKLISGELSVEAADEHAAELTEQTV